MSSKSALDSGTTLPTVGLLALAGFLMCIPLATVSAVSWGGHDLSRVAQVALGLVCAICWTIRSDALAADGLAPGSGALCALALALGVASVLGAAQPAAAAREAALLLGMLAIASSVASGPNSVHAYGLVTSTATAFYTAILCLVIAAALASGANISRADLFVGYDNFRFFNHVQTAALPMALAAAALPHLPRVAGVAARVGLVGGSGLLFVSAGRGTFVSLLASALLVWALVGARAWPTVRALGLSLAGGFALFAVAFLLWPWLALGHPAALGDYSASRIGSDQARFYLWQLALDQIRQSPWLGIGPMHYAHWPNAKAAHPHNIYLQVAAEWGLPMLFLVGGAASGLLLRFCRRVRACADEHVRIGVPLLIGCVAVAADGMVSGNFVMPVSQVWIAVLLGWSAAWWRASTTEAAGVSRASRWSVRARPIALAVLASQLWLAWDIWPEAADLSRHVQEAVDAFPTERTQPRFWSHGRF